MRCPLFVGIETSFAPRKFLEDHGATIYDSSAGGYEIRKGTTECLAFLLGTKTIASKSYRIFTVLVYKGNICQVYRWFKNNNIPVYTLHNAPVALKNLLKDLTAKRDLQGNIVEAGTVRSTNFLAGESITIDSTTYTEGAALDGSEDKLE